MFRAVQEHNLDQTWNLPFLTAVVGLKYQVGWKLNSRRLCLSVHRKSCYNNIAKCLGAASQKVVLLGGAHLKAAYHPPPSELWSKYHFFLLEIFFA